MKVRIQTVDLDSGLDHVRAKVELEDLSAWKVLSWVRNKPTWIEPTVYPTLRTHPDLASSLVLLKSPDWKTSVAVYPVSTLEANNDLVVQNGQIVSNVRRVFDGDQRVYVVVITANDHEERDVVRKAVEEARALVGGRPKDQPPPDFFDRLGNCTWESLLKIGERPTKDLLLSLVKDYSTIYLIDDGWQDTKKQPNGTRCLDSFRPWGGFGGTLAEAVRGIKQQGVTDVGVWLTLQGYWDGIDPESDLIKAYACQAYTVAKRGRPRGGMVYPLEAGDRVRWLPTDTDGFWDGYFKELAAAGISFVKVDNQASYDQITGKGAESQNASLWRSLVKASKTHFQGRVIMCMSHNERMLNGPGGLDFARPHGLLLFRNSDDFDLKYPDCHQDFIAWNVYQTILTGHLSLVPDFDMFASGPGDLLPVYHGLLRVLGPGPTLLSDTPDVVTDRELIERLTAKDKNGNVKVVKADVPASVPSGRWFWDNIREQGEGPALVSVARVPGAKGALIGAWNVRKAQNGGKANDCISLRDVEDALGGHLDGKYVVWKLGLSGEEEYRVASPGWKESFGFSLERGECELFIVAKVYTVGLSSVAVLGLLDKLAPLAGVAVDHQKGNNMMVTSRFQGDLSVLVLNDYPTVYSSLRESSHRVSNGWRFTYTLSTDTLNELRLYSDYTPPLA